MDTADKRADEPAVIDDEVERLLAPWVGPCRGLPPFDLATPERIEQAMRVAIGRKRDEVSAIATNAAAPSFANTLEALEDTGRELRRVEVLYTAFLTYVDSPAIRAVQHRIAPLRAALDDAVTHDAALFQRIDTLYRARDQLGLDAEQRRLLEVVHERFRRAGAALDSCTQRRLETINARLAALSATYGQNLAADGEQDAVRVVDVRELDGVPAGFVQQFAAMSSDRGAPGHWLVPNARPAVWAVLTHAHHRGLRERAWRMWNDRGDHAGPHDNKPVVRELLVLRGEKARLLGYASYAHYMMADRMLHSPEAALALLERTWEPVAAVTQRQIADYQAIADAEGARIELAPWDRQYYAEKLRQARFGVDGERVKEYLLLDRVLEAMFWLAGRVHGLEFTLLTDVPVLHPSVRVYAIRQQGEPFGVIYFDLFARPGKQHGSHQAEWRTAEHLRERVLPISNVVSGVPPPPAGEPALVTWEYANVIFHEFGHALHILSSRARYPTLGSLGVAWDLIELPSLLNERWLRDRELLARFARHHANGAPMPRTLIDNLERAAAYDRVFSVNLDYLLPAILDLRLHLLADGEHGGDLDPAQFERELCAELGLPAAWDLIMRVTSNFHSFVGPYAAGLYSYLWADILAADVTEAFTRAPHGLYDAQVADRWRSSILTVGNTVPADAAYRHFMGRDPDPAALLRRYGLDDARCDR